ncbi:MAG: TRAP transporter fused permease subunit [Proteobacteria bacterium]|nr:TRAP transporter fused permease subunit [Pseudomonadota bacterium]MDA0993630.1 TRAP transporter fused permease subunit [Pseudomonadota bacterium]
MTRSLVRWAAVLFALFHVYNNLFNAVSELWFAAIHFGGFGALCALSFHQPKSSQGRVSFRAVGNVFLALLSISVAVYLILFENALYARESEFIPADYFFAGASVLLAMELTRRTSGWFMPLLIAVSMSYVLFLGRYVPGLFSFPGLSIETVLYRSYFSGDGMFGMVANISSTFVFMFILFGAFLLKSGAGDFIVNVARSFAGRYQGGAGHIAVIGSGLMGSVSGSAVATTVSTGVITIPMMTRSGFTPRFAAGVEAAASTGGQLMPPVMGAGAFVMSSYTQIPYLQIISVSVLPALLYFLTVSFFVRIEARRIGVSTDSEPDQSSTIDTIRKGWHFIIPLAVLVGSLIIGYTPVRSSVAAIFAVVAVSWISETPMTINRCVDAILDAVRIMVPTAILLIAVGLVVNAVTTTGLGNAFSIMIVEWANGSLLLTLVLVALASLILGMGLPVTASYIVLATLAAPALYDLMSQSAMLNALSATDLPSSVQAVIDLFGGDPARAFVEMPPEMRQLVRGELLDPALVTGMLLSAHLIIFWLSQDSNVTPPVCLVAFAAAAIAGTPPMRTGLTAWKIAKGLYLVPALFAFTPIITGNWAERLQVFVFAGFGLYALAGVLQWHLESRLNLVTGTILLISAFCLLWMPFGVFVHLIGAIILAGVVVYQHRTEPSSSVRH